jgi:zinc D-Ala-D-Ala carboxypeptidase
MKLAAHFSLAEFCVSQTSARRGKRIEPTEAEIHNLTRLCVTVLEPLRIDLGRPIVVTSGLRPLWLNQAIGGSKTSAHMDGRAADIVVPGMSPLEVCRRVCELRLLVDQCIYEFGEWTHLGIAPYDARPRDQYLTARVLNGRTVYEIGVNA